MSLNIRLNMTIDWEGLDADHFQQLLDNVQNLATDLEAAGATVTAKFDRIGSDHAI